MTQRPYILVVKGEAASKSNNSRIVWMKRGSQRRKRPAIIKSEKAMGFSSIFRLQAKRRRKLLEGDLKFIATIYYASRRSDLDESLVLDLLQDYAYKNDRQVKEKHVKWGLDRSDPRVEIRVEEMKEVEESGL